MKLNISMKITNSKSCKYWFSLKEKIENDPNNKELWVQSYELFKERITDRYLNVIDIIEKNDTYGGEGFSIMTILCSLIEFLETTLKGINFNYNSKNLKEFEYSNGNSRELFISFLTERIPFKGYFDRELAKLFYFNVRNGLFHEAQTKNNWYIRVDGSKIITQENDKFIVNRIIFKKSIEKFVVLYKNQLLKNKEIQDAFIRKFNNLCQ